MRPVIKLQVFFMLLLLIISSLACRTQVGFLETPKPVSAETLVAATMSVYTQQAEMFTPTMLPATETAIPEPTLEPFGEVYVYTVFDNVNLRVNPGLLFKVSRVMPKNTRLLLLGQSPGGEWLNVQNDEGIAGWVNINAVLMAYDGPPPPVVEPEDVFVIEGIVLTELGTPVSGIGYAVVQNEKRTDAVSNATGHFYAYLPSNMSGVWTVSLASVACTSNTMDSNCNCIGGRCGSSFPEAVFVELPQKEILNFVWK